MPEARYRLSRPRDESVIFDRRRRSVGNTEILPDEPDVVSAGDHFRWGATAMTGVNGANGAITAGGRGSRGIGRERSLYGSPGPSGRQNTPAGSGRRPRGSRSMLPSWYPRKPLQDITSIMKSIERRRACLGESEGQQLESPLPRGQRVHVPSVSVLGAPFEHDLSMISPSPTIGTRRSSPYVGKVPKILLDITDQNTGPSDFLTPQKKLLNSIDTVEKVVMEELHRLKKTPTAKKVERVQKVRTLMSMR